jgi:hypothetical protein
VHRQQYHPSLIISEIFATEPIVLYYVIGFVLKLKVESFSGFFVPHFSDALGKTWIY